MKKPKNINWIIAVWIAVLIIFGVVSGIRYLSMNRENAQSSGSSAMKSGDYAFTPTGKGTGSKHDSTDDNKIQWLYIALGISALIIIITSVIVVWTIKLKRYDKTKGLERN